MQLLAIKLSFLFLISVKNKFPSGRRHERVACVSAGEVRLREGGVTGHSYGYCKISTFPLYLSSDTLYYYHNVEC